MSNTLCIGITGGIGSGKSYVCQMLEERGVPIFYTDDEAKLEMKENRLIHQQLTQLIGPEAIQDNQPVKAVLSAYICQGKEYAQRIDDIVHPQVKLRTRRWKKQQDHRINCPKIIGIECALLFESRLDELCDKVVTVTAPREVCVERIVRRDSITPAKAQEWINLQMPQEEKIKRSDFVITNDNILDVHRQVDELLHQLKNTLQ